jgi:hypothetical protein
LVADPTKHRDGQDESDSCSHNLCPICQTIATIVVERISEKSRRIRLTDSANSNFDENSI